MDKEYVQLWARIHVRTGLGFADFCNLDMIEEVPVLLDAIQEHEEQESYKRAQLYTVMYRAAGDDGAKPEDFLGESRLKDEIAEEKLSARAAGIRMGRKSESPESPESPGEDDESLM